MKFSFCCLNIICLLSSSCSSQKPKIEAPVKELAQSGSHSGSLQEGELLANAKKHYSHRLFTLARESFESLRDSYPSSPYIEFALIKIADCYFESSDYDLASKSYEDFITNYPSSSSVPYALLKQGKSLQLLNRGAGRDISPVEKSIIIYDRLLKEHPTSYYVKTAENLKFEALKTLSEHNNMIAGFYKKKHEDIAAEGRQKVALEAENKYSLMLLPKNLTAKRVPTSPDTVYATLDTKVLKDSVVLKAPAIYSGGRITLKRHSSLESWEGGSAKFFHPAQPNNLDDSENSSRNHSIDASSNLAQDRPDSSDETSFSIAKLDCKEGDKRTVFIYLSKDLNEEYIPRNIKNINGFIGFRLPVEIAKSTKLNCFEDKDLELRENGLLILRTKSLTAETLLLGSPSRLLIMLN